MAGPLLLRVRHRIATTPNQRLASTFRGQFEVAGKLYSKINADAGLFMAGQFTSAR
jgi:hypothetical protein